MFAPVAVVPSVAADQPTVTFADQPTRVVAVHSGDRRGTSPWLIIGVATLVVIAAIATTIALTVGSDDQATEPLPALATTIPGQLPTVVPSTASPIVATVSVAPTIAPATAPATVGPVAVPLATVPPTVAPATVAPATVPPAAPVATEFRCVRQNIDFSALRNGPGLEFDLLDEIPPGTCDVPVFGLTVGGGIRWLNVEYAGINGWSAESNFRP